MASYQFRIEGLPPKKDGANTMWEKDIESRRLIALRQAASQVIPVNAPLTANISLTIELHVGPINSRTAGDLDNFITGICDGLMTADWRCALALVWASSELQAIHPYTWRAIEDDSQVIAITAQKVIGDTGQPWFLVILDGE